MAKYLATSLAIENVVSAPRVIKSCILTTHYMEEADILCDRIAIIDHGRIIKTGTPEQLKASFGGDIVRLGVKRKKELRRLLSKKDFIRKMTESDDGLEVTTTDGARVIPKIMKLADSKGIEIDSATLKRPTLEDVFISLTGKDIRAQEAEGMSAMAKARFRGR